MAECERAPSTNSLQLDSDLLELPLLLAQLSVHPGDDFLEVRPLLHRGLLLLLQTLLHCCRVMVRLYTTPVGQLVSWPSCAKSVRVLKEGGCLLRSCSSLRRAPCSRPWAVCSWVLSTREEISPSREENCSICSMTVVRDLSRDGIKHRGKIGPRLWCCTL